MNHHMNLYGHTQIRNISTSQDMSSGSTKVSAQTEETLPFQMHYLPDFVLKKCEVELKETPENKQNELRELRKRLDADCSTSGIDFNEDLLVRYLRHSKYDINRALHLIQNFVHLRRKRHSMFLGLPDEYLSSKKSTKFLSILPRRCPEGCVIVYNRMGVWDPNELEIEDFKRLIVMLFGQLLRDPMSQINGFKIIHDFHGTSMNRLRYCTPQNLHLFYHVAVNCLPGRWKEIHLINETPILKVLWAVIKQFLSEKIAHRVFFHSNVEELLDYFPRSTLPAEYGGDIVDNSTEDWIRRANKEQRCCTIEGQSNYY